MKGLNRSMIPPRFDEQFLAWFRKSTEKSWSILDEPTLEDFLENEWGGCIWQRGTCWLDGLSEQEIQKVEERWQIQFPPDYRLFLRLLHSVDKKWHVCAYFDGEHLEIKENYRPSYFNWQTDEQAIQQAYDTVIDGMLFDVMHNVWWPGWGKKPATPQEQEAKVRALVAAAPRLIPIVGNRYLLAEPCQIGNPVLSIMQTDIIVYTADLHSFFLQEAARFFDDYPQRQRSKYKKLDNMLLRQKKVWRERLPEYETIPFWGQFVGRNDPFDGRVLRM
jgi:hypothetical protein